MIFSLQRRFLLLLLLPVALILLAVGFTGWFFARSFLLDQWVDTTRVKLEKVAHQINMQLNEKLDLINLISKANDLPTGGVTQAFLVQQLIEKEGVRFVDIEVPEGADDGLSIGKDPKDYGSGIVEGLYTMELCGDFGFCAPIMDPGALDRSLRIVKILGHGDSGPMKRLVVRISFDSFLNPIREMGVWGGNSACLVTSTGQFLAHTDKAIADRKRLGDNGDPFEIRLLDQIRHKDFGTLLGEGHPPDVVAGFHKIPSLNWYIVVFSSGSEVLEPVRQFRNYYALAGFACLAVILLLIRLTTRRVGRSIAEISAAAEKVEGGDYSEKLPVDGTDEIGQLNRSFNHMIEGLKQRDLIEHTFGRYVDKKVAKELMSRPEALRLGGEKRTVTIMMSDIRNFTGLSEKLQPEDVIKLLNRYFARMIAVIEHYKGIIVDFYGDSILVFFNGLEADVPARAMDAVRCALEMQHEMRSFNKEKRSSKLPVLQMGIGVHTGEVIVGNIGTESRAKYGIVGADVNLTDRIQATASAGKVVISEKTYEMIADQLNVSLEFNACLKGVEDQKQLYEIDSVEDNNAENSENPEN
ncbi:MAG: HAMP domain-containing protein [Desulfomonile tiedjei]|uniref:HAMP domain-containing protein n=1 Tax=Desulfomonile tiedjei TaxID=2358 RepID=A0A9D6Z8X5_9BACT|nr:HAMP domain-containing protein [Desulfomonile tiedjei]